MLVIIPLYLTQRYFYRVDYQRMSLTALGEYEAWDVQIIDAWGDVFAHHIESTPDDAWARICAFDAVPWGGA